MYDIFEEHKKYDVTKKGKATPYYLTYLSAYNRRPFYEEPAEPVIVDNRKLPKRTGVIIAMLVVSLLIVAFMAVGFLGFLPESMDSITALYGKATDSTTEIVDDTTDTDIGLEEVSDTDTEADADADADTEEDVEETVASYSYIGIDDIVKSTFKKFGLLETEEELVFYNECLANIDNAETNIMLAYYAIPVSIALTIIVALYIVIKSIIALCSAKRSSFSYISLILLLFSLLGVFGGVVWNAEPLASVLYFFTMNGLNMVLGLGYVIVLVLEIVLLICSLFAYRSKKTAKY